jgi:hypothetical protein
MVKEYGPDENGKQLARMVFVVLIGLGILIGIANLIPQEDTGPCSQYTTQEAIDFCASNLP